MFCIQFIHPLILQQFIKLEIIHKYFKCSDYMYLLNVYIYVCIKFHIRNLLTIVVLNEKNYSISIQVLSLFSAAMTLHGVSLPLISLQLCYCDTLISSYLLCKHPKNTFITIKVLWYEHYLDTKYVIYYLKLLDHINVRISFIHHNM